MTHIKIEVPANDHIALSAMAEALNRIAAERGPSVTVGEQEVTDLCEKPFGVPTREDIQHAIARLAHNGTFGAHTNPYAEQDDLVKPVEGWKEHCSVDEQVGFDLARMDEECEQSNDTLDADGLPWDNRIHSRGKTRLSDDTWRLARKPNDKTDEEWSTHVESVKSELKAVQDIPVTQTMDIVEPTLDEQAVADLTPPVTLTDEQIREEVKEKLESGEVTIEAPLTPPVIDTDTPNGMSEANEAPVAPVTPPTSLTPPIVEAPVVEAPVVEAPVTSNQPSVTTFQELMLYITGNAKKRGADNELIKSTLLEVDPALVAIPLIATRADLIPKFVAALEAKLS